MEKASEAKKICTCHLPIEGDHDHEKMMHFRWRVESYYLNPIHTFYRVECRLSVRDFYFQSIDNCSRTRISILEDVGEPAVGLHRGRRQYPHSRRSERSEKSDLGDQDGETGSGDLENKRKSTSKRINILQLERLNIILEAYLGAFFFY